MQRTNQGNIVNVMTNHVGQRSLLAPAGHAPEDQAWVAGHTHLGAEPQPFHHPRPEAFDKRISLVNQLERRLGPFLLLEVNRNRAATTSEQVKPGVGRHAEVGIFSPVQTQHLRAHIREQHRTHWSRTNARKFHNFIPR